MAIFAEGCQYTDARQILVTKGGKGGPAEGIFQVGDVILGVGGNPFSYDAGTKLGQAVSVAKTELGAGKWP